MQDQLALDLTPRSWGGKRDGAGRKSNKSKGLPSHDTPHASRPKHVGRNPLHAVLRAVKGVGSFRRPEVRDAVDRALRKLAERTDFRVVHLSIQRTHFHFLIEANDNAALESGMRALAISLAKRINRALDRKGKLFAYRYHTTALSSPRQARNALAYVLNNWRRHREDERSGLDARFWKLDRYSSADRFDGWHDWKPGDSPGWSAEREPAAARTSTNGGLRSLGVSHPQTWLLATGWQKANRPIRTFDTPGPID